MSSSHFVALYLFVDPVTCFLSEPFRTMLYLVILSVSLFGLKSCMTIKRSGIRVNNKYFLNTSFLTVPSWPDEFPQYANSKETD